MGPAQQTGRKRTKRKTTIELKIMAYLAMKTMNCTGKMEHMFHTAHTHNTNAIRTMKL